MTSSTLLAEIYGVLSSATYLAKEHGVLSYEKFAISKWLCIRNKSAKKMLNRSGSKIEPCGIPKIIASHSLYEYPFFSVFYVTDNQES